MAGIAQYSKSFCWHNLIYIKIIHLTSPNPLKSEKPVSRVEKRAFSLVI